MARKRSGAKSNSSMRDGDSESSTSRTGERGKQYLAPERLGVGRKTIGK